MKAIKTGNMKDSRWAEGTLDRKRSIKKVSRDSIGK